MMKLSSTGIIVLLATAGCSSKEGDRKPTGDGAQTVFGLVSDISTGARLSEGVGEVRRHTQPVLLPRPQRRD